MITIERMLLEYQWGPVEHHYWLLLFDSHYWTITTGLILSDYFYLTKTTTLILLDNQCWTSNIRGTPDSTIR